MTKQTDKSGKLQKDGKILIELRKREEMAELQPCSFILVFLCLWSTKMANFNFIPKFLD